MKLKHILLKELKEAEEKVEKNGLNSGMLDLIYKLSKSLFCLSKIEYEEDEMPIVENQGVPVETKNKFF
jgi:hypothetical protein